MVLGFAVSMVVLAALNIAGLDGLAPMIVVLLVGFGFLGLVVPTTSVMALADHGEIAGAAAALMGMLQLVLGAVVIAVMGVFVDGTAWPMVAGIAVVAVVAWPLTRWTLGSRPRVTAPA
ncbi:MAG TPA: hypothetical protein VNU48_02540 [Burkholderiaceae bacterium]|nr:hypothetical protein [Burkholderiaceae bacterium]